MTQMSELTVDNVISIEVFSGLVADLFGEGVHLIQYLNKTNATVLARAFIYDSEEVKTFVILKFENEDRMIAHLNNTIAGFYRSLPLVSAIKDPKWTS